MMTIIRNVLFALFALPVLAGWSNAVAGTIGLVLPSNERYLPISQRMEQGARLAAQALPDTKLVVLRGACENDLVSQTAERLRAEKVEIVIGLPCFQVAAKIAETLKDDNIPLMTTRTRNALLNRLRNVDNLALFELSSSADAEAEAIVEQILKRWAGKPFAIVDDGSVYGRGLADAVRLIGEEQGIKPVLASNFRPLQSTQRAMLRRLAASGIEALFVAAAPADVVTIAKDLRSLGYNWSLATGEQARLWPYTPEAENLPTGTLAVAPGMLRVDPNSDLARQLSQTNIDPEEDVLIGYLATEIASKALEAGPSNMLDTRFETSFGSFAFDGDGRLSPMPFQLWRWDGGALQPASDN